MNDPFKSQNSQLDSPGRDAFIITPSDSDDLQTVPRSLYIGTQGDISVVMVSGAEIIFGDAVGILPIAVSKVKVTGTTASNIVGIL